MAFEGGEVIGATDEQQAIAYLLLDIREKQERIGELEAALREIVGQVETSGSKGECGWTAEIARKALESK